MTLEPWQWALAVVAALAIGFAKTGIGGLGMLAVVIFTNLVPAKQASGIVLPMLCFADVVAVLSYRRHAVWAHLWRLLPWTAAGVLAGWWAMGRMDDRQARGLIGAIILAMLAMQLWRRRQAAKNGGEETHGWWFAPLCGVLAGFTTLIANAAGPLLAIYLLAMQLPKLEYMGTGALFFMALNLFKVPFMMNLGLINAQSFTLNLWLAPAVLAGALLGRKLLMKIDQKLFENLALGLSAAAGVKLLF